MAGTKLRVLFFFKDMTPQQVNQAYPQLLPSIKVAKKRASKINEGLANEEMTVQASYHICHHDTNEACEPEIEI